MIVARFVPHRMQRKRRDKPVRSTSPSPLTAEVALTVRVEWQCVQSILSAHPNLMRSPVVRTCFVDIPTRYADENDS
jgi:hypothetical protein